MLFQGTIKKALCLANAFYSKFDFEIVILKKNNVEIF